MAIMIMYPQMLSASGSSPAILTNSDISEKKNADAIIQIIPLVLLFNILSGNYYFGKFILLRPSHSSTRPNPSAGTQNFSSLGGPIIS